MALGRRSISAVVVVSCGAMLALSACGSSGSGGSGGAAGSGASGGSGGTGGTGGTGDTGGTSGSGGSGGATVQCQEPAQLSMSGTWAAKVRMTVALTAQPGGPVSICPVNQQQEATLFMYFDVQQNASDPTKLDSVTSHVCSVTLPSVTGKAGTCDPNDTNLVTTSLPIPDALKNALPNIHLDPVTASLSGSAPGATITTQKVLFVAGSTKPAPDLPTWDTTSPQCSNTTVGRTNQCETTCVSDCTALSDDDGDGFPGITLNVCGYTPDDQKNSLQCQTADPSQPGTTIQGRAWLDLQIDPSLTGTVKSSCEVTGTVDANIVYNVVGADVQLNNSPLAITSAIQSLPTFQVQSADSVYRMLRVDGQYGAPDWSLGSSPAAACAAVLQHQNDI